MIGLACAGLVVFGGVLSAYAACTNPAPLPSGFAAPCPVFFLSATTVSQSQTLTLTATPQAGTDYIYTTAYYAKGSTWLPLTLSGNNAAPSYSSGPTSGVLTPAILQTLTPGTNYVVLWDWLWDATAGCYKGPGLNQCNTGTWRVQSFMLTAPSPTSTPPAYSYSQSAYTGGQPWSGILDPTRAANWQRANVGVAGGIPTNYTQCGATIAAYTGTAATINNAIAACGANQFVLLGAGTFNLSSSITTAGKSSYILRGSGPNSTKLVFSGAGAGGIYSAPIFICSINCWAADNSNVQPGQSNAATWTAEYAKGAALITLTNVGPAGILNGDIIILDQRNDTAETNGYIECDLIPGGFPCSATGQNLNNTGRYISNVSYAQMQHVKVISGCASACTGAGPFTITIAQPLYANNWHAAGQATGAYFFKGVNHVGIESLMIDATNCPNDASCQSGITFMNCEQCWAKNVSVLNTRRNHIWLVNGSRDEVRDSYFYGVKNSASQSYGIEMFPTDDSLIENNIFQQISSPFMMGGGAGNVWAYNFSRNNPVGVGYTYMQTSYLSHSDDDYMNLFEGNSVNGLFADQLHGTSGLSTVFRNWLTGRDYNIFTPGDTLTTNQTYPFDLDSYNRGYNIIGNVLGTPGYHNLYEAYAPNSYTRDQCNHAIYELSFGGGVCGGDSAAGVPNDTLVRSTLMRWGNYDTVHGSVQWNSSEVPTTGVPYINGNPVPANHNLPASFYLPAKPSWWGTMPYPAVGPDVTGGTGPGGFAYNNPAANCYFNVMGGPVNGSGNALNFNAASCYP